MADKENMVEQNETDPQTAVKADKADKTTKPTKPEKKKKKGKFKEFWRGFRSEWKKIVWPTWKQVRKNSLVVLVVVIVCAIAIGALDYAFSTGIGALASLFS